MYVTILSKSISKQAASLQFSLLIFHVRTSIIPKHH